MSVPILNTVSTVQCPHGGRLLLTTTNTVFRIDQSAALLVTDVHPVVGCPFVVGTKPQPCVTARWIVGATLTSVGQVPVLLQTSVGVCYSAEQIPQGPPLVIQVQQRARGI